MKKNLSIAGLNGTNLANEKTTVQKTTIEI